MAFPAAGGKVTDRAGPGHTAGSGKSLVQNGPLGETINLVQARSSNFVSPFCALVTSRSPLWTNDSSYIKGRDQTTYVFSHLYWQWSPIKMYYKLNTTRYP